MCGKWPRRDCWLFALALAVPTPWLYATPVPVRYPEGTSHGFVVLRAADGKILAAGDATETVTGNRISSALELHFKDGSIHEEHTEFTQGRVFKLLSDHLRQQGPSFPKTVDTRIDVPDAQVTVRGKNGKPEQSQLRMPQDVANGLLATIAKDRPQSDGLSSVAYVITSPKPMVVNLEIRSRGEEPFAAGGAPHKALHLVFHIDIKGVAGALAKLTGKQPADFDLWIAAGNAPTFLRFLGPLYEGGPTWSIELTAPRLEEEHANRN